jgi:hypothetical protein
MAALCANPTLKAYAGVKENHAHMSTLQITPDQVVRALPSHLKKAVTPALVDQLNNLTDCEPEVAEAIRENFLSYTKVLQDGRFKAEDYLSAVKFVSFKLMGYSNQDAYFRAFPDRHAKLVADGREPQEIAAYVSMYSKGKLVNLILEQTLVPTWVLNQDVYQRAINVLATEMTTARSEMVRVTAANSILQHLKKPEAAGPLINIDQRENSGVTELTGVLKQLAQQQLQLIQEGVPTKDIAAQRIIEVEPVNS